LQAGKGSYALSRYSHLFREQVGATPRQYIEQQRPNSARQLLELTPMSVKETVYEVGFASPFYFTLRFNKRF
jgi:AraC family transcriptional regulator of arabinose operon